MSKSVNVDFVTRQIEVDTDGKEHFISAAMAAKDAEQSMLNAQNAATHAEVQADSVKKYNALWFDSVAAMKAEPSLTAGAYVNTAGYYSPNDGGGASYLIREKQETDTNDGGSLHELANGLVAALIVDETINYKQFGAKGDGVTDDYHALKCCHDFANKNNIPVVNSSIIFYVSKHEEKIPIKTNTFFHECVLKSKNTVYTIDNDEENETRSQIPLSTFFNDKDTPNADYIDKFVCITYPYKRGNVSGEVINSKEAYGYNKKIYSIPSSKLVDDLSSIIVDAQISRLYQKNIRFEGLSISIDDIEHDVILTCERNNTIISNIYIDAPNVVRSVNAGAVISVKKCANVIVSNVNYSSNLAKTNFHYAIRFDETTECKIINFISKSYWHGFVANNITNFVMENCATELFDVHSGIFGDTVIQNCQFTQPIALGYGYGTVKVINCNSQADYFVTYRTDSPLCYKGDIYIDKCECLKDSAWLINTNTANVTDNDNIDDIFKIAENRNIFISNSKSKCWYTAYTVNKYVGELNINVINCSNVRYGGIIDTVNAATLNAKNSTIYFAGNAPNSISYNIYDCTCYSSYLESSVVAYNSKFSPASTYFHFNKMKLYNCELNIPTSISYATNPIPNGLLISCTGTLPLCKNLLAKNCHFNNVIGNSSTPTKGGIFDCTANNNVFAGIGTAMRNCYYVGGKVENDVAFSYEDF